MTVGVAVEQRKEADQQHAPAWLETDGGSDRPPNASRDVANVNLTGQFRTGDTDNSPNDHHSDKRERNPKGLVPRYWAAHKPTAIMASK